MTDPRQPRRFEKKTNAIMHFQVTKARPVRTALRGIHDSNVVVPAAGTTSDEPLSIRHGGPTGVAVFRDQRGVTLKGLRTVLE